MVTMQNLFFIISLFGEYDLRALLTDAVKSGNKRIMGLLPLLLGAKAPFHRFDDVFSLSLFKRVARNIIRESPIMDGLVSNCVDSLKCLISRINNNAFCELDHLIDWEIYSNSRNYHKKIISFVRFFKQLPQRGKFVNWNVSSNCVRNQIINGVVGNCCCPVALIDNNGSWNNWSLVSTENDTPNEFEFELYKYCLDNRLTPMFVNNRGGLESIPAFQQMVNALTLGRRIDRAARRGIGVDFDLVDDSWKTDGIAIALIAINWLVSRYRELVKTNPDIYIFVHLRDAEIIGKLLKTFFPKVPVKFVLTSRPLTTQATDRKWLDKIERQCPKNIPAIHFDTGFAGSIPKFMRAEGWNIAELWMLNATDSQFQIPGIDWSMYSFSMSELFERKDSNSDESFDGDSQRLNKVRSTSDKIVYASGGVRVFWSRYWYSVSKITRIGDKLVLENNGGFSTVIKTRFEFDADGKLVRIAGSNHGSLASMMLAKMAVNKQKAEPVGFVCPDPPAHVHAGIGGGKVNIVKHAAKELYEKFVFYCSPTNFPQYDKGMVEHSCYSALMETPAQLMKKNLTEEILVILANRYQYNWDLENDVEDPNGW